jgi:hypothetical protein
VFGSRALKHAHRSFRIMYHNSSRVVRLQSSTCVCMLRLCLPLRQRHQHSSTPESLAFPRHYHSFVISGPVEHQVRDIVVIGELLFCVVTTASHHTSWSLVLVDCPNYQPHCKSPTRKETSNLHFFSYVGLSRYSADTIPSTISTHHPNRPPSSV